MPSEESKLKFNHNFRRCTAPFFFIKFPGEQYFNILNGALFKHFVKITYRVGTYNIDLQNSKLLLEDEMLMT